MVGLWVLHVSEREWARNVHPAPSRLRQSFLPSSDKVANCGMAAQSNGKGGSANQRWRRAAAAVMRRSGSYVNSWLIRSCPAWDSCRNSCATRTGGCELPPGHVPFHAFIAFDNILWSGRIACTMELGASWSHPSRSLVRLHTMLRGHRKEAPS